MLVTITAPITGSIFKSIWQETPGEWTQPELAGQFQLLRSVAALSNRTLERARVAKTIRSSLEGRVEVYTESESVQRTLAELTSQSETDMEFLLSDCLRVSDATVQRGLVDSVVKESTPFFEEDTVPTLGEGDARVQVVAAPIPGTAGRGKCPRCWKWVCQEGEELCVRCRQVEQPQHTVNNIRLSTK